MKRQAEKTKDGSSTLFVPELNQHYHSIHGALQESLHVFIGAGWDQFKGRDQISILEVGFGTGLNALLTAERAAAEGRKTAYTSIEKYPLTLAEAGQLNYGQQLPSETATELLTKLHQAPWEEWSPISQQFQLKKLRSDLRAFEAENEFDLIYFDAFAPSAQPQLWTIAVFESMYRSLKPGGMLTTYCVKGEIRRNMKVAGFKVEKIPGPPGKREMARAWKK